jgi:hypothetical protein
MKIEQRKTPFDLSFPQNFHGQQRNYDYGALWQGFSKCFSNGFYRNLAKPLTKKRLPSTQKTASKLKPWRSHFAICTMEVKPKIVASRGFFPTCDIEATTSAILPNTLQNDFSFTKETILLE